MPGATKKEIYLAKSVGQLNELAELPAKFKSTAAKLLVKTSDKMLKEAQHSEILGDEERAYVLFMKYFNVVTYLKKTADYKKQKAYYDDLLGPKNLLTSIDKAEALSKSLKERYDQLEAESVASKLASLDSVEKTDDKVEPDPKLDEQAQEEKNKKTGTDKKEEPAPKTSPGVITCQQLFELFEDRDAQIIIMDVRPMEEFQETRINHKNIINVPAEAIKPGTTVTYIEKALPMDSLSLWKQRGNIDHIILLDWNSIADKVKIGTSLQSLKDALFKYDSTVIIKSEPLILDGGYEQWMLQYPTKCVNPVFDKLTKPKVISAQDTLMDFDYPDFDETFMTPKPARTNSIDSSGSSTSLSSSSSVVNGDLSGNLPRIDRSTKPKIDRSTKSNVTTVQINQSKTGSLYPDVKTVSRPGGSLYRDTSDTSSQNNSLSFRNTDTRAGTVTTGGLDTNSKDNKNSSNLPAQSAELSDDLKELELQKKRKMEELRKLEQDYERMEAESRARMEQLRLEEKRLSDLEDLKKKQQMDVADLMRMKRNIQSNMVQEKQRVEQEQELKQLEERQRREELEQLSKVEDEKRRRQEEVNRLRMDRKKKEEEKQEYERKLKEEKELREARERARLEEELRQKDISAAEERAQQLKIEEERKAREKIQMEERIQQERELAAKLDRERQAALEEKRRKQAENDRLEAEKREKLKQEKERAEKERLEIERRKREEEDKKKAAEAKRIADEKLRLMNEAKSKPKLIPSPHLLKGWEKQLDPRTNRYFYINHNDGTTQWDPPNLQGEEKGGTYTTKLKDEPSTPKSSLKRSSSSPNIAQLFENEPKISDRKAPPPSVDRGIKPIKRPMPVALPAKRRDLNPVYGNVGRALTGLRNLGNTCYMNSTIQCLNNTSPLVTYLLTDMYLFDINRGEKSGSLWELTDDFAFLVKALWSGQYRCINPRDFKSVVGRQQPMFAGYEQQDSQEFLTFLLDGLHEGLNKVKTRPKIAEQENDKLPDHVAAEMAWRDHKLHNESIIVELFQGQLKSTIMCLTCRKRSVTFQAFMFLSLPIPSSSRCSLQDCLRQFAAEEKMTGSSRWKCPQCRCYRDSVKNIVIWKLPPILLVALNRFVYEGQWRTKINAHVDFPVKDLDMTSFVQGPQPRPYKLYAVSNHFGSLDGGHYTACCRNPNTQKWYKYDDHEVFETSESSIKTSAAYVLYYTSIELLPPEFKPNFS